MSNKFLTSGGDINLSNGSQTIFGATIGAVNLSPSAPVKTNSVRELVSEKLDIADVNNLTDDLKIKQNLSFVKNDSQINPDTNQIKMYAKTDGNLYTRDSAGTETIIGGGGSGGINYNPATPAVNDGMIFTDGTSTSLVKNVTGFRLDTINNTLVVNDLETANQLSIDTTLTNINYFPLTGITRIDGELDVDKIKNTSHTAEIEFEASGQLKLTCDDQIEIVANSSKLSLIGNDIIVNGDREIILEAPVIKLKEDAVTKNIEVTPSLNRINFQDGAVLKGYIKQSATNDDIEILSNMGKLTLDSGGNNDMVLTSTNNIDLVASGEVLCNQTPSAPTAITNKSYVDNAISGIDTTDLVTKTQNIDLTETTSSKTRMTKPLEMGADALFGAVGSRNINYTTLGQNLTSGWEFDTNTTYKITKVKISKAHISNSNQVVYLNHFRESDNSIINTNTFTLNQDDANYYYVDLSSSPIVLSSYQGSGTKWCVSTFLSTGDKIQASSSTQPNPLLLNVYGRTNPNNVSWNFPTTKGAQDFMPVIDFEFTGLYETGSQNLQALDINCRNINLSGKILTGKGPGNITDYYELATKGYADTIPSLFIAATDEVNSITTTGEKMRIFSPKAYTINKIKVSVNTAGGTNFQVGIFVNSSSIYNYTFGAAELINTITLTDPITILEDNPITINVLNSGGNTASGLKCFLSYN